MRREARVTLQELARTPPDKTEMTKQFFAMFDRRA